MIAFITALFIAASVPVQHTEVAPKQVAFVFDDQKAVYNITDTKKKRK
jgi:hypothetical protein